MKYLQKRKKVYLFLSFFLFLLIGVGYSLLNTALNINGNVDILKNTWDVYFENIVVVDGSVEASSPATIVDTTTVNFAVTFQSQGESYEFEVDVVNSGTIDAMLSEIIKTDLESAGVEYIDYSVEYSNGSELKIKDALPASSTETLKIVVKYRDDIDSSMIPQEDQTVTISLKLVYVQDDGTGVRPLSLYAVAKNQAVLDNTSSTYVTSSSGVSFSAISSNTNGKGVYEIASTASDKYPIYYYRGAVANNNVIFAGFCWKMVRTTDTGGVKLIYNGIPNDDGSCTATGNNTQIGTSSFNSNASSPVDIGYMYGTRYTANSINMSITGVAGKQESFQSSARNTNYIYSDSVTYDESTGMYTLVDGENRIWKNTYANAGNQYKYTCFSETENSCETVKYVTQSSSNTSTTIYYTTFTGGEMAEELQNKEIVYGNDVTYDEDTGMYTLVTTTTSKIVDWPTDFETIVGADGYHYTCFTTSDTCSEVSYIYDHSSSVPTGYYGSSYYIKLTEGKKVTDALSEMFSEDNDVRNRTDSTIKTVIDIWYASNMIDYTDMLEDTIWCNDRSIYSYGGWQKDSSGLGQYLRFSPYRRRAIYTPTLSCSDKNDAFTVNDTKNGNGKLTYPVGLLTSDEVMYAGGSGGTSNSTYYLYTGGYYWTLAPYYFVSVYANAIYIPGALDYRQVGLNLGVRPSVSLKSGIVYADGDGTSTKPYVVEKQ